MKSILKRIIVGVFVVLIVGFVRSCEVKAQTIVQPLQPSTFFWEVPANQNSINLGFSNAFYQLGRGHIIFNFVFNPGGMTDTLIYTIETQTSNGGGRNSCIINSTKLKDIDISGPNIQNTILYSVNCPVNFNTGRGLSNIYLYTKQIQSSSVAKQSIYLGNAFTFVGESDESDVVQAIYDTSVKNDIQTILTNIQNQNTLINSNFQNLYNILSSQQTQLQQQVEQQQQTNQKLTETNDFLKDSSLPDNASGDIGDLNDNIASNGTISSLVTMPITFLQKIINGLNGSCSPITIGELYDYNMTMPCINPQDYIGAIWNIIDVICAGFLSYHFGKKLVTIFHKVTSMKDGGLEEAYD